MPAVESSILIRCTPEQAFDLSQDYGLRLEWDPFLADLKFLDGATESGIGVRTWVKSKRGLEMTAEYVAFDRGRVVAIKMIEGPWFFRAFGGSWRFRDVPDGVEVTMRYSFEVAGVLRVPLIRQAAELVIRRIFLGDIEARLAGLRRGVEELRLLERT
jgi:ribosome-associated toxin RatA of RatAB toxin-antitoxin module